MPAANLLRQDSGFHDSERQNGEDCNNVRLRVGRRESVKFREPEGAVASSSRLSISYRLPNQP